MLIDLPLPLLMEPKVARSFTRTLIELAEIEYSIYPIDDDKWVGGFGSDFGTSQKKKVDGAANCKVAYDLKCLNSN